MLLFCSCSATDKIEKAKTFTTVRRGNTIEISSSNCGSRHVLMGGFHDGPGASALGVTSVLDDFVLDVAEDVTDTLVFFAETYFGADSD